MARDDGITQSYARGGGKGFILRKDDGIACILLEGFLPGPKGDAEIRSTMGQIAQHMKSISQHREVALKIAIPESLRLNVVRGRQIEMRPTADGRLLLVFRSEMTDKKSSLILQPGQSGFAGGSG